MWLIVIDSIIWQSTGYFARRSIAGHDCDERKADMEFVLDALRGRYTYDLFTTSTDVPLFRLFQKITDKSNIVFAQSVQRNRRESSVFFT